MARQRVVSLHGLNTKGSWQKEVESGISPHFTYDLPKYTFFRWFGFTKIAAGIGPLCILLYLIVLALAALLGVLTLTVAEAAAGVMLLVFAITYFAREKAVDNIADLVRAKDHELPPHVVAHSLGTYLLVRALRKHPSVEVKNIVLVGSVVHPAFDWGELAGRHGFVRNEVGTRDPVGLLTPIVGAVNRDFGDSGRNGFTVDGVHRLPATAQSCPDCRKNTHYNDFERAERPHCAVCDASHPICSARIHDILFEEYGHSDSLSARNAGPYWVPFFWNINPVRHARFKKLCLECRQHAEDGDTLGLLRLEGQLLEGCWGWTGSSLRDRIRWEMQQRNSNLTEAQIAKWMTILVRQFWREYVRGLEETSKPKGEFDPEITHLAYPPVAMWKVIKAANL